MVVSSELILAASISNSSGEGDTLSAENDAFNIFGFDRQQGKLSANYKINHKFNAKNTMTIGAIADYYLTNIKDSAYIAGDYRIIAKNNGSGLPWYSFLIHDLPNSIPCLSIG